MLAVFAPGGEATAHILETRLGVYVVNTVGVAALTGIGVTLLGVGAAWLVAMHRFPGRDLFDWALVLPLAAPAYLLAYAYADLTAASGALGRHTPFRVAGAPGAAFVFAFCLYPYVYVIARRAFAEQAAPLLEAARVLGRGPLGRMRDVALPLARPAMVAGGALALIETMADYGAVAHLGVPTITAGIFRAWAFEDGGATATVARLALLLLVFCAALLWVERRARGRARVAAGARSAKPFVPKTLGPVAGALAALACAFPIIVGLAVPAVHMAVMAVSHPLPNGLFSAALHSTLLAGAAAGFAALVAFGLSLGARSGDRFARLSLRAASAGYAAPGAVAALGALSLFAAAQGALDSGWRAAFGDLSPLVLTSGLFALFWAYQTRYAAAALGPVATSLERVPPSLDDAARTLGATRLALASRVHWPLAKAGVVSAMLLVFVEVMKELPATMILSPFDFPTLSVMAHTHAHEERLASAAAPALLIPLIAAAPLALAARALAKAGR